MTRVEELHRQVEELAPDEREELRLRLNEEFEGGEAELSPGWQSEIARGVAAFRPLHTFPFPP